MPGARANAEVEMLDTRDPGHDTRDQPGVEGAVASFYAALGDAIAPLGMDGRLQCLLEAVLVQLDAEIGSILLLDADTRMRVAASCGLPDHVVSATCIELGCGISISGHVARMGEALLVRDVERDNRFRRRNHERYYTRSFVSAPVLHRGTVRGVINASDKRSRGCFGAADLAFLEAVGRAASAALRDGDWLSWSEARCVRLGARVDG